MKRCLVILIEAMIVVAMLSANPFMPVSDNVSFYSSMIDVYSNPASISFRSDLNNRFSVALDYSDDLSLGRAGETLGLIQNMNSYLNVGFGGQNLLFSASFGFLTEDRTFNDGKLSFDFVTSNNIQIDWGWHFSDFGLGVRIKGGSQAIREDREVEDLIGVFQNFLLAKYTNRENSNYFSLGVGVQYHPGDFSLGAYSDGFLVLDNSQDLSVSSDMILKTLSLGASWRGKRFTESGELMTLRPRVSLGFNNLTSESSALEIGAELTIQLLPRCNLSFGAVYHDERNANSNWFIVNQGSVRIDYSLSLSYEKHFFLCRLRSYPVNGDRLSFTLSYRAFI